MDEKIIKKNAVPVIAAMITALAFSFTGLPMDGNTSVEKMSDVYNGIGMHELACMDPASYFIRERMGGLPEIQKLAGTCFGSDLFGGNASWNFLFYKWKLGFSVWRKETDPDLSRMFYRILYYL